MVFSECFKIGDGGKDIVNTDTSTKNRLKIAIEHAGS